MRIGRVSAARESSIGEIIFEGGSMKLKYALWATLVWTLLAIAGSAVAIWYITTHPVPGASTDKRAGQLGQGIGTLMTFGYVAIWVPYLMRLSKQRREERRL